MPSTREVTRRGAIGGLAAATVAGSIGSPALAQSDPAQAYPGKPIRIIVGFGPGGGNDIFARLIGQKLSERLGQPVLVENKPGAGAVIATDYVAKAPPDGYTLLVGATGAMTISPAVYSKLPYVTLLLRVRGNTDTERWALERRRTFDAALADLVREASRAGQMREDVDPSIAAKLISGTVNSIVEWYRPGRHGAAALPEDVVRSVFEGVLPHP